ncbi:MAG: YCF48-related protein [Pirellulales bacterium]
MTAPSPGIAPPRTSRARITPGFTRRSLALPTIALPTIALPTIALPTIALLAVALLAAPVTAAPPKGSEIRLEASPVHSPEMLPDAELTDLFFLDPERGWAVGDRGVIWTTENGGRSWQRRESPLTCRWESVWFTDPQNGWIVGGWHQPGTMQSRGAVLRTRDGGQNWMPVPASTLPQLLVVRFRDEQHGWAIGEPSPLYPSGVFRSEDGGRSWAPLPAPSGGSWLAGDFAAARPRATAAGNSASTSGAASSARAPRRADKGGVVVGRDGRAAVLTEEGLVEAEVPGARGRHVRCVQLDEARGAWLAGDDGLLLQSTQQGLQWSPPAGEVPAAAAHLDWRALATVGSHVWLVGDPGSCVLHSSDRGATWQLQRTGQELPLHSITFLDSQHGWAAGALGTLLVTRDGGDSWKRVHGGGRVALLGIFADERQLPLELFAQTAGNDGYLSYVELPFRRDLEAPDDHAGSLESRVQAAVVEVGGSGAHVASSFPVRQRGLGLSGERIVASWNELHQQAGFERLVEYLVARLRTWRPEVVVTDDPSGEHPDALAALTRQAVLAAVQRAGEPQEFPQQIADWGLTPWRVRKVFGLQSAGERASVSIPTSQLVPRWSRPLSDIAGHGRFLLTSRPTPAPSTLSFRLIMNSTGGESSQRDLLDGISLPSGADGRRDVASASAPRGELADLTRIVQKQRMLQQLLLRAQDQGSGAGAAWLAQLDGTIQGFGKPAAGDLYWQLGQRFLEAGQGELALETWQLLVTRLPHHELADAALVRLLELQASGEWNWRRERAARQALLAQANAAATPLGPVRPAAAQEEVASTGKGKRATPQLVQPATVTSEHSPAGSARQAAEKTVRVLEQSRPALYAAPRWKLSWLATLRAAGRTDDADQLLRSAARGPVFSPHGQALADELWLAASTRSRATGPEQRPQRNEETPRPLLSLISTPRPRLDGQLDDPTWEQAVRCAVRSEWGEDADWPTTAWLARDSQFFYLAATCRRAPHHDYVAPSTPRPRDASLEARDRIEFFLDTDRDYATAFRLTIDERGWTQDACAEDASWNPTWYVAVKQDAESWTIEAAIPWDELVATPPAAGTVWSVGIQRVIPGAGFQSWTRPAGVTPQLAGHGWLRFE